MDGIEASTARQLFDRGELRIGGGDLGGKANGLVFFNAMLCAEFDSSKFPDIEVSVPPFAVIGTDVFDQFLATNALDPRALAGRSDEDIATAFQRANLPEWLVGELQALLDLTERPLALRSSSLMEDAIFRPFAGVYETKMVPNNQAAPEDRLRKVAEAIKLIYASTFLAAAERYIRAAGKTLQDEKMAVVVQEVVGDRRGDRFYPLLSGVARSYNFYPTGSSKPKDGVVSLALGLGKTIVDGSMSWTYCPARPKAPPPYGTIRDLLSKTQMKFWCVNMAPLACENPIAEDEHLIRVELSMAEDDGVLGYVASTYDPQGDRLVPGTSCRGPRVLNFATILVHRQIDLNPVVRELMAICEQAAGAPVEIEFALALPTDQSAPPRLGFLQVRPMFVSNEIVELSPDELTRQDLVLFSDRVMGNGCIDGIRDIVFVKPEAFESRHTPAIAAEVDGLNRHLLDGSRPYLLVGFGRWGSSEPWLGIPVDWGNISGARAIVEATLPEMDVELSQGAHFFHNISGNGVVYLSVHHTDTPGINWEWLKAQRVAKETQFLRHVELDSPLGIRLDGRSGRGGVWRG